MHAFAETGSVGALPAQGQAPGSVSGSTGSSLWLRLCKGLLAVLLLPVCAGVLLGFYDYFWSFGARLRIEALGWPAEAKAFLAGAGAFGALAILFWRPLVLYVFAHEMVHALATWACGGKVSNLQASANGGQIVTSKSNTLIRLAPYCVPLYALLAAALFLALNAWWRPLGSYHGVLAAVLGFSYAFHLGFTLWSLQQTQPDLKPDGWLFSRALIFLANTLVAAAVLGLALKGHPSAAWEALQGTCMQGWAHSLALYHDLLDCFPRVWTR